MAAFFASLVACFTSFAASFAVSLASFFTCLSSDELLELSLVEVDWLVLELVLPPLELVAVEEALFEVVLELEVEAVVVAEAEVVAEVEALAVVEEVESSTVRHRESHLVDLVLHLLAGGPVRYIGSPTLFPGGAKAQIKISIY